MNVTDIINAAMLGSESDIAVSVPDNTPAYTTEIEKLAAALDFIGANLEDSEPTFEEKLAEYAMIEEWLEKEAAKTPPQQAKLRGKKIVLPDGQEKTIRELRIDKRQARRLVERFNEGNFDAIPGMSFNPQKAQELAAAARQKATAPRPANATPEMPSTAPLDPSFPTSSDMRAAERAVDPMPSTRRLSNPTPTTSSMNAARLALDTSPGTTPEPFRRVAGLENEMSNWAKLNQKPQPYNVGREVPHTAPANTKNYASPTPPSTAPYASPRTRTATKESRRSFLSALLGRIGGTPSTVPSSGPSTVRNTVPNTARDVQEARKTLKKMRAQQAAPDTAPNTARDVQEARETLKKIKAQQAAPKTVRDTVPDTVRDTVPDTVRDTVPDTAPTPKKVPQRKYKLSELDAMSSDEREALFRQRPGLGQNYQDLLDRKARAKKVRETAAPGNFDPSNLEGKQEPQTRKVRPSPTPIEGVDSSPVSRENSLVVRQKAKKVKNRMSGSAPAEKPGFFARLGDLTGISDVKGRSGLNRALRLGATAATAGGLGVGAKMGYDRATQNNQKKTAALFEKVAEDRINPAKINAGPADAYSGMALSVPASEHDIVRAKAQKVRDRINAEMQQYVNNTGKGYNLDGHLNVFNK